MAAHETAAALDVARIRADFPLLAREVNGRPLAYLDSASTSQKPRAVLEAMTRFYETSNANVHRGVYTLGVESTDAFEAARDAVQALLNAASRREVVFTRNTTEAINLVAQRCARKGRAGAGRRLAGRGAHAGGCAGARLRFLRHHRP